MRAAATKLGRCLAAAALLASLALALLVAVGPRTGAYRTLSVLSASMQPTFGPGSVVVVRPVAVGGLAVGDVITYNVPVEDGRVITHRIVEIDRAGGSTTIRTQGDANAAPDPWTTTLTGEVAWRAERSLPALGYVIGALREPLVSRLLTAGGPALLGVVLLLHLWRRPERVDPAEPAGEPFVDIPRASAVSPVLETVVLAARTTRRVRRWTDEVMSGRRWLRSTVGHA